MRAVKVLMVSVAMAATLVTGAAASQAGSDQAPIAKDRWCC